MQINRNFDNLVPNYLFAEVASRTNKYMQEHPDKKVIKLGIGDVTLPLAPVVIEAMKKGAEDLAHKDTFKGYPDYEGYAFLREAISNYYAGFGVTVDANEIFVSDGAKSDCGNIGDIFGKDNVVLVTDPVYPVYVDSNIMAGRKIVYANSNRENNFAALPDENVKADIIYLCSPNNPTGSAYTADELKQWVDYAIKNDAIILYDAAYEAFITEDLPRSIFAIEGARKCAIEMCSLSKTAGFTGTRCGYTIIPRELEREVTTSTILGIAVRQLSLMAFLGLYSVQLPLYSVKRVRSRLRRIFLTTRIMQKLSHQLWMNSAFIIQAVRTHRIFGSSALMIWAAGNSLTSFLTKLM